MKSKYIKLILLFLFVVGASYAYNLIYPEKSSGTISKSSEEIFNNENALKSYVKKYGLKETIGALSVLEKSLGDCHQAAHKAGRFAFDINNNSNEIFKLNISECHSGGYHGAIEAFFKKNGTKNLAEDLKVICSSELNGFFTHQCFHGIGHGLMAWTDYQLIEALKTCDLLEKGRESCYSGVFMENVVASLNSGVHKSKYLNNDPQYPCNFVDDKYKNACYFFQTSRMMQIYYSDFQKIAAECMKVPNTYQALCFSSFGRDISGANGTDYKKEISLCQYAPQGKFRIECLKGAVQDRLWSWDGADTALSFCQDLEDVTEKDACYTTIVFRAKDLQSDAPMLEKFCSKIEEEYRAKCST